MVAAEAVAAVVSAVVVAAAVVAVAVVAAAVVAVVAAVVVAACRRASSIAFFETQAPLPALGEPAAVVVVAVAAAVVVAEACQQPSLRAEPSRTVLRARRGPMPGTPRATPEARPRRHC